MANSFSETFSTYVSLKSPYLQPNSIRALRETRRQFLKHIENKPITDYSGTDVLTFVSLSVNADRTPGGVNVDLRNLRSFGSWCTEEGILGERNPFKRLKLLKVPERPVRFLSSEEFQRIYNVEPDPMLKNIYLCGLVTGLRVSDIVSLKWEQVDMRRNVINMITRKTSRRISIPFHPMLLEVLRKIGVKEEGPLFVGKRGHSLTTGYVSHRFLRAARKARVEGVTFHTLRKTFASWLVLEGVGIHEVQKLLGHSSVTLTEKYYSSLQASDLSGKIARIQPVTGSLPNLISGSGPDQPFQVQHKVTTLKM